MERWGFLAPFLLPRREGQVQPEGQGDVPHLSNEAHPHTCDVEGGGTGTRPY